MEVLELRGIEEASDIVLRFLAILTQTCNLFTAAGCIRNCSAPMNLGTLEARFSVLS